MECPCGEKCDTQNINPCIEGGIVKLRHNKLRDITVALLNEVYHDVAIEPTLQPITESSLLPSMTNSNESARLCKKLIYHGSESIF